ncbi:MAG: hypothetical protein AMJ79_06875 [Phycisphaerae bacterium SM23_30]|nr:MAG: hypothetical protein AMJ79_06875 [Phycisphaerae bacterium SM23_30]
MLAGILSLAGFLASVWTYRRIPNLKAAHKIAWAFKLLAIFILVLCLAEPLWIGKIAASGENYFVILADNSASMTVHEKDNVSGRGLAVKEMLNPTSAAWLTTLTEHFQVRQYMFDDHVRRLEDLSNLDYQGKSSLLQNSLQVIAQRYQGRPLAGIVLLTDGNATDLLDLNNLSASLPPVYPVIIGSDADAADLALTKVTVNQTSFEAAPVTIQAQVTASGYDGKVIRLDLLDESDQVVESQTQTIDQDLQKHTFRFRFQPQKTGIAFYRLHVSPPAAPADQSVEATKANNSRTVVVNRPDKPYRILYVSGRPNWEYKFLQRALDEDEQVHLVGLIRVARREPKYNWLGRRGETSNPLYRGFDRQDLEQTEQYDQPVLVPLNIRDEDMGLIDGFPNTPEQLFGYHALILDDVDAAFFTHDQMNLIRRFVAERGGGFMMLGGKESFQQGNFADTPIAQVLPIYLDGPDAARSSTPLQFDLTREGWLQPWARLYENEQDEIERLLEMPPFRVLNLTPSIKPGAGVIATSGQNHNGPLPALVVQRYGNGRAAAVTIGDVWRWGLKEPQLRQDMNRFWRQTLRWLVADVPRRITIQATPKPHLINQPVELQIVARDQKFENLDNLAVTVELRDPDSDIFRLHAQPILNESGHYQAAFIPRRDDPYLARALVSRADGTQIGSAETGFATDLEAEEFSSIEINQPLLNTLAQKTGGRVITPDQLDQLARDLPRQETPLMEMQIKPLWDLPVLQPLLFVFLLICLLAEWTIRRRRGLP